MTGFLSGEVSVAIFAGQAGALGLMVAFPTYPAALYLGSAIFGLGIGNVVILPSVIIQHEFTPMAFGVVLGLSTAIGQIAYSLIPPVLGAVHDLSGGTGSCWACASYCNLRPLCW